MKTPHGGKRPSVLPALLVGLALGSLGAIQRPMAPPDGGEETGGNNLSVPAIFPDGEGKALRGTMLEASLNGQATLINDQLWFHQDDPDNEWQAENLTLVPGVDDPLYVHWVDWGDNLEARPWTTRSVIRVETVLYQDLLEPMLGFEMLQISGLGVDEVWGTNGVLYDSYQATVYTPAARLVIQKLTVDPEEAELVWNPDLARWDGDALEPLVNKAVWEGGDGPGYYSAEINVGGKVVYGYNWNARNLNDGAGTYRITFAMDETLYPDVNNTFFDEYTEIMVPVEEEEEEPTALAEEEEPDDGAPTGGVAYVVWEDNLTYIDVPIVERGGGGGGGDGGGGPKGPPEGHGSTGVHPPENTGGGYQGPRSDASLHGVTEKPAENVGNFVLPDLGLTPLPF